MQAGSRHGVVLLFTALVAACDSGPDMFPDDSTHTSAGAIVARVKPRYQLFEDGTLLKAGSWQNIINTWNGGMNSWEGAAPPYTNSADVVDDPAMQAPFQP